MLNKRNQSVNTQKPSFSKTKRTVLKIVGAVGLSNLASILFSKPIYAKGHAIYDVIIIGAGMAGLSAAKDLLNKGYKVLILEATERHGGRVYSATLGDTRIDMGAEEHYLEQNNPVYKAVIKEFGEDIYVSPYVGDQMLSIDGETCWEGGGGCEDDEDINNFWQYLSHIESRRKHQDFTVTMADDLWEHHQIDKGHRAYHLYENGIAGAVFGTSLDKIGIASLTRQNWNWSLSNNVIALAVKSLGYLDVLNKIWWDDIIDNIQFNSPVVEIDTQTNVAVITTQDQTQYQAKKVIVTASIGVLQSETIKFNPKLPVETVDAYNSIGMGKGLKVALRFSKQFWEDKMAFLTTEGFASSCWVPTNYKADCEDHIIMCYPMGNHSEVLSKISQSTNDKNHSDDLIIAKLLEDLDSLFAGAATQNFASGIVQDWTSAPYVRGSYSYTMLNTFKSPTVNKRKQLAKPVRKMIYFAGEATSNNNPACVPGALGEGARAASQIHAKLKT
ncbi:MAG: monoamine oxidase [Gammaproteobacteria bacterium]|jgi:monoamine oxidase